MEIKVERGIRYWWMFALRGIIFILFGIYMIALPGNSFEMLGFLFGLIILMSGITALFHVIVDRDRGARAWYLMLGVIDLVLGVILMGHVTESLDILRIVVGLWFFFGGISLVSFSLITGRSWMLVLGGIISFIFSMLILFNPAFGDITILLWTAVAFIINGAFNILLGFRLKRV